MVLILLNPLQKLSNSWPSVESTTRIKICSVEQLRLQTSAALKQETCFDILSVAPVSHWVILI